MRPFYRVDSSRTNPQEGSGLGLSIIRRIMEIFEGRVVIENVRPALLSRSLLSLNLRLGGLLRAGQI